MKELALQKFLRNGGTPEQLKDQLGINCKSHQFHSELLLFKYDQIDSPSNDPIVVECRGVILNRNDNWNVVARAFDRFFNYGEGHADTIDWFTACVMEKADGSLAPLYHYDNKWNVSTSGTPDASGNVNGLDVTFAHYFWATFESYAVSDLFLQNAVDKRITFCFELMGPMNRIVVVHDKPKIVLLGARDIQTGKEFFAKEANELFLRGLAPCVKEFQLQSIGDIASSFEVMSPLSQEGYVIGWKKIDGTIGRVKCKHPGYVALHHAKDGMTTKAFVEIARTGEVSEVIAAFPEFKPLLDDAKSRYDELLTAIEADYAKHKDIPVQKDFALAVKDSRCSAACFQLRAGKVKTIREFLAKCHIDIMMRMLGY